MSPNIYTLKMLTFEEWLLNCGEVSGIIMNGEYPWNHEGLKSRYQASDPEQNGELGTKPIKKNKPRIIDTKNRKHKL